MNHNRVKLRRAFVETHASIGTHPESCCPGACNHVVCRLSCGVCATVLTDRHYSVLRSWPKAAKRHPSHPLVLVMLWRQRAGDHVPHIFLRRAAHHERVDLRRRRGLPVGMSSNVAQRRVPRHLYQLFLVPRPFSKRKLLVLSEPWPTLLRPPSRNSWRVVTAAPCSAAPRRVHPTPLCPREQVREMPLSRHLALTLPIFGLCPGVSSACGDCDKQRLRSPR